MAVRNIGKVWLATCEDIDDVFLREQVIQKFEPTMERLEAHGIFASLYARYVRIVNRLGQVYDQTLQVQKRACVRRILESATKRMMELQAELKDIEMSEFMYVDQKLIEEKWRPEQVQMLSPFYYPLLRPKAMQAIVDGERKPPPIKEDEEEGAEKKSPLQLMLEEKARLEEIEANRKDSPWESAVKLIKIHEKARQARRLRFFMKMHPEVYWPQPPPPGKEEKQYSFLHKPDQPMLIPVHRTHYESNFYKVLRSFSQVKFYENPHRTKDYGEGAVAAAATCVEKSVELIADEEEIITDTRRDSEKSEYIQRMEEEKAEAERRLFDNQRNEAATKIQRCFLHFQIKRLVRRTRFEHFVQIGMADERRWDFSKRDAIETKRTANKLKKAAFDEAFQIACEDMRSRIVLVRSPWIMEDISDQIRYWFREMYEAGGEMDTFPPAAKGGTILVLQGMTPSPWEFVEFLKQRQALAAMSAEQRKKILDDEKKKKAEEKKAKKMEKTLKALQKKEKLQLALAKGKTWEFADEDFITKSYIELKTGIDDYLLTFRFIDEFANTKSKPYMQWSEEQIYADLHIELRAVVDELMRVEYELLKMAQALDAKKKYKAPKPVKDKKKKGKKGKGQKAEMPIEFGERDVEEVYDAFLEAGVIEAYPANRMEDYIGDVNFGAYELRNCDDKDPWHFMGELKDVLQHYIQGMGDLTFKHPKSLCIMGPPGCGKKFLINALAREMGVVKFNLSPSIVVKFKDSLQEFAVDVMKMAKLMQPSMMFINGAHYPFIKKMEPDIADYEPKLAASILPKMMKAIKPQDRIMLMGTTNQPWNCAVPKLKKTFEVILLSGGSDYGSTLLAWRTALLDLLGTDRMTDFSALSKVTTFYGTQQILDTVNTVVDVRRRVFLKHRPLKQDDLLEHLLQSPLVTDKFPRNDMELEKYRKIFQSANKYAKKRAAYRKDKEAPQKKK